VAIITANRVDRAPGTIYGPLTSEKVQVDV
jgi:hypothetical protein